MDEHMSGGVIRRIRRRLDVSQRGLAELAGVSKSTVARWETGDRSPSLDTVGRLADLAALRLVLVDDEGQAVSLMRSEVIRDLGDRYYPAHLDPHAGGNYNQLRPGRRGSGVTYSRGLWHRIARSAGLSPDDHPTPEELPLRLEH